MTETEASRTWICHTCVTQASTPYCATCGEEPLRPRHLTLGDLGSQLFKAFSSIDGKLLRSLRWLVIHPGALTQAYVEGRRKPFLGPLPLFLIANAIFFAMQSLTGTNIFSSPLDSHLHHQDWSGVAQRLVTARLTEKGTTLAAYAPLFDDAAVLHAKTLIVLMVFAFAAVLALAYVRRRRPLAAHVVFALHLYGFLLLLFCLCLAIEAASVALGGPGLEAPWMDAALSALNLAGCALYLRLAIAKVYGASGLLGAAQTVVLTAVMACLVLAYRFAVFILTLYWT